MQEVEEFEIEAKSWPVAANPELGQAAHTRYIGEGAVTDCGEYISFYQSNFEDQEVQIHKSQISELIKFLQGVAKQCE